MRDFLRDDLGIDRQVLIVAAVGVAFTIVIGGAWALGAWALTVGVDW